MRKLIFAIGPLLVLLNCAVATDSETVGTGRQRFSVSSNDLVSPPGNATTSYATVTMGANVTCGGNCVDDLKYDPVIGFNQVTLTSPQNVRHANWWEYGSLHTDLEWGTNGGTYLPPIGGSFAYYSGWAGLDTIVTRVPAGKAEASDWVYLGVGYSDTGYNRFPREVTVAWRSAGVWNESFLTGWLDVNKYPWIGSSSPVGDNEIEGLTAAYDPTTDRTWVLWTTFPYWEVAHTRAFLTWFQTNGNNKIQGPTWDLHELWWNSGGTQSNRIGLFGAMKMAIAPAGMYGQVGAQVYKPLRIFVAYPGEEVGGCGIGHKDPYQEVNYMLATVTPVESPTGESQSTSFAFKTVLHDAHSPCDLRVSDAGGSFAGAPGTNWSKRSLTPSIAFDSTTDTLLYAAEKSIWTNVNGTEINRGTRVVFTQEPSNNGPIPASGSFYSCSGHAWRNWDQGEDGADCDQYQPVIVVSKFKDSPYPKSFIQWRERANEDDFRERLWGATFTPLLPLDYSVSKITADIHDPGLVIPWSEYTNYTSFWPAAYGSYDDVLADPTNGRFVSSWSDNRIPMTNPSVRTAAIYGPW
jgi:hypothetical protein